MANIIIREGRRDREERIYGRVARSRLAGKLAGSVRNAEEAADVAYHELRNGPRGFDKPLAVEDDRQKVRDDWERIGADPDRQEYEMKKGRN